MKRITTDLGNPSRAGTDSNVFRAFLLILVMALLALSCAKGKKESNLGLLGLIGGASEISIPPLTDSCVQNLTSAGEKASCSLGSVSFKMAYVPPESFFTGTDDSGSASVSANYLIAETEVTYELWNEVYTWAIVHGYTFANAGARGAYYVNPNFYTYASGHETHPVTFINWRDALVWTNALTEYYNQLHGTSLQCVYTSDAGHASPIRNSSDGSYAASVNTSVGSVDNPYVNGDAKGFRLLTKNEWELAARFRADQNSDGDIKDSNEYYPGSYASGATGDNTNTSATSTVAWYTGNTTSTQPVNSKSPNGLGIYDMSGNIWEWNYDWATINSSRLILGGSWSSTASYTQIGGQLSNAPFGENWHMGFRIAKSP